MTTWRRYVGKEQSLKFFSPVTDKKIPKCDLIYIGGGFPEVLGQSLERNTIMRKMIKKHAEEGIPIYAECGGLMYLTKSISFGKKKYKMVGLFDAETQMTKKMTLNYTEGRITSRLLGLWSGKVSCTRVSLLKDWQSSKRCQTCI